MGALGLGVAVLAPQHDRASGQNLSRPGNQGEGRTDHHLEERCPGLFHPISQVFGKIAPVPAEAVHFPVAGDQGLAGGHSFTFGFDFWRSTVEKTKTTKKVFSFRNRTEGSDYRQTWNLNQLVCENNNVI
jgi:hypothetical protein